MLTRIRIKGFRGIKNCEITNLGKVNVFVGRNNSGKSSILDALCVARAPFSDRLFDEPILHLLLKRKGIERSFILLEAFGITI